MKALTFPPYSAAVTAKDGTLTVQWRGWISELFYTIRSAPVTVANLPPATNVQRAFVSDATATAFASIVAGGGANTVPVYSDGTNWRIG